MRRNLTIFAPFEAGSSVDVIRAAHAAEENGEVESSGAASLVLKIQFAVLGCAFVIAFMLGALAPAKGHFSSAMALPEWNDQIQPWEREVEAFAARVAAGFGVRHEVALEFSPWILEASSRQQLSPELLAGLVLTESSFRKNVTSPVGAVGPAQVRPDYWSQFCGTADLGDPEENIYCGAQILAHYVERCGAEACALSAYNVGPYDVNRQAAGKRYVAKVAQWRKTLEQVALERISYESSYESVVSAGPAARAPRIENIAL